MEPTKQAEQLRECGNYFFAKNKLSAAIDAYTEAINLCPNVTIYWTNRALCHRKLNDWVQVEEDCRGVLQLDHSSVKAHYMLGLALLQREQYAEGVKELEKALDLGRGANPKSYIVEEVWQELAKARYLEWEHASTKRSWELQSLKEACQSALKEKHERKISEMEGIVDDINDDYSQQLLGLDINDDYSQQLHGLEQVFDKASEADMPTEVPDYLCCKIMLDIFRDPVITPSGVTYERSVILDHLTKVGKFDPITRKPLHQYQLVPNLAVKEAVQAYLQKHGWAYNQVLGGHYFLTD